MEGHRVAPVRRAQPQGVGRDGADLRDLDKRREVGPERVERVEGGDAVLAPDEVLRLELVTGARRVVSSEVRQSLVPPAYQTELRRAGIGRQAGDRVEVAGGRPGAPEQLGRLERSSRLDPRLQP